MYQLIHPWQLILGSASPRRRHMLGELGLKFSAQTIVFEEKINLAGSLGAETQRLALLKNLAFGQLQPSQVLLTADTLVGINGHILGKPQSPAHAHAMLAELSGQTHQVATGFCLQGMAADSLDSWLESGFQLTQVTFRELSSAEIKAYVASNESMDKAGAYGVQHKGAALIEGINGSFHNVVGLPLARVIEKLLIYQIITPEETSNATE